MRHAGGGFFPLDERWELTTSVYSPERAKQMVWLAAARRSPKSEGEAPPLLTLDDLAWIEPEEATEDRPPTPKPEVCLTVLGGRTPQAAVEALGENRWQVCLRPGTDSFFLGQPVTSADRLEPGDLIRKARRLPLPESYRPGSLGVRYLPRIIPRPQRVLMVPVVVGGIQAGPHERELINGGLVAAELAERNWPWCTVGRVIARVPGQLDQIGSAVLVGPNLILTASHAVPWGATQWSMEFIPGFRNGDPNPRPFGSAFVQHARGIRTEKDDVHGRDYVIASLYQPIGRQAGWMGTWYYFDDDSYRRSGWQSIGYPGSNNNRPMLAPDLRIEDVDSDGDGRELETAEFLPGGWSGGPLFGWFGRDPRVVGIASGNEEEFSLGWFHVTEDHSVFAGGQHMVDLVKYGYANWA